MRKTPLKALTGRVWGRVAALCVGLVCAMSSLAAVDVCDRPVDSSHVSLGVSASDEAGLDDNLGTVEQENYTLDSLYRLGNAWSLGVGYRYKILRFDSIEPQTNGHLHTLFFPAHRQSQSEGKHFRFSIAPSLSASSNVMKDPGQYDFDAVQLLAAVVWGRQLSNQMDLQYGICGDHRFGGYKIYPMVSLDWQPHVDWTIDLGFPTAALRYQPNERFDSALQLTPSGNEWYVKDASLQYQSQFIYESYLLELSLNWQLLRRLTLTASVARQVRNRYEMTLLDGSRVRIRGDDSTVIGAAAAWEF